MNVSKVYNSLATKYDSLYQGKYYKKEDKALFKLISKVLHGDILDVGCGTGLMLEYIKIRKEKYLGVDISAGMIDKMATKFPAHKTRLCAFEELPENKKFDSIISTYGAPSYIEANHYHKFLELLKKDGFLFLMFYAKDYFPGYYTDEMKMNIRKTVDWGKIKELNLNIYQFTNYAVVTNATFKELEHYGK